MLGSDHFSAAEVRAPDVESVAREVGSRLVDHRRREQALLHLQDRTSKPLVNLWRPSGFTVGGAGLALMCATFDDRFPGEGWDLRAHEFLARGLDEVSAPDATLSLFSGAVGYTAAVWHASHRGQRYRNLIGALDGALLPRMRAFARRLRTRANPDPDSYDVVTGISGWVGYLCDRAGTPEIDDLAREVTDALVVLFSVDGVGRLAHRPYSATPTRRGDDLVVDCGLAHGLAGPLAALSLLETEYRFERVDVGESIRWAAQWLMDRAVRADGCLLWPVAASRWADAGSGPGESSPNAGSWCHGSSGVARALDLAGVAVREAAYREFALRAMHTHCEHQPELHSPNLCHGLAGQLMITLTFAHDTGEPLYLRTAARLARQLLDRYRANSLLGYLDVEDTGLEVDHPGLLRGAAGVALALSALTDQQPPRWTRLLLIA